MRFLLRSLRWLMIVSVLVVLMAGSFGYAWLRGSLPQVSGTISVKGITSPVEIVRDVDGVPHIKGANEADALFGLGYAHAQDRLWQMEFQRRIGNARLSEVLGEATIKTDQFLRTLGPARAAQSAWPKLRPEIRALTEAYVGGINEFIRTHRGRQLPVEFTILGFAPEPWRPEDIIVWSKMMAWDLGGNWDREILRAKLTAKLGAEKAAQLMPAYLPDGPLILPDGVATATRIEYNPTVASNTRNNTAFTDTYAFDELLEINRTLEDKLGLGGVAIGSNNWVVGGQRTTTGKPLLANDPHLGSRIPSIWYLAHISGGALDAIGATIPGLPGIVIGHNHRIAWGVTNTGPDVQDLYQMRIDDQNRAEHNGVWEPMEVIQDEIKVKGHPAVPITIRITRYGPLISDATEGTGEPLAFRWTALNPEDHTLDSFLRINTATNWNEFREALRPYVAPMQNFVYADVDGNIGYYAPGALPIRRSGDGTVPAVGWTDANDWIGYVPFEQLPHAYNPPQGYIATANNKVAPDSYPYLISTNWASPYRATRIVELIEAKSQLSPDDIIAIQADVQSNQARKLLPLLLRAQPVDERSQAALKLLQDWDGSVMASSAAAAVFEGWYHRITSQVFADELGEELWEDYRTQTDFAAMVIFGLLNGMYTDWCDDTTTAEPESCDQTIGKALAAGLAEMAEQQGNGNIEQWRWDTVHHTMFPHNPFNSTPLRPLFSRSIPNGGDGYTVNVAPIRRTEPYKQYHVASYREVLDLNDLGASRFMHTVGQSGNVLSGDYSNLLQRWQRVEYLPMRFTEAALDGATRARLVLQP